ncbi:hypothetical protein HMPREF2987_01100 [Streptococcus sp. HMSC067H01]|uniref:hypothetical protein n=1 Tax=Streptococcus sp. HMSC067H01 TaxID=1739491 RepID=UPI0008C69EB5|nr:hypothetical protein [Streptococcus sp. HMSC067H01]OFP46109.1 hypothetical protein HMPREF2987_01100 [Streptococcus sp. HMSC067H01]
MNNYKDILISKNTIFIITLIAGIGLLTGLVLHQEKIQAERGNVALIKQQKNHQDVEQVKNAIKNFNIDSETIIEDWKKIQELKPTTDEGKKTLADFLTSTADKVTNHYSEKALKLDIKDSDSQFQDKQTLETTITSLQKILEIIKNINSANDQTALEEKIKPIQELISKFQKQVEVLTKKEEQKSNQTETTSSVQRGETYNSEDSNYTPTYSESYGNLNNSQAPAAEQSSSGSTSSGGDNSANTGEQTADSSGSQSESNSNTNSHQPTNSGVENP